MILQPSVIKERVEQLRMESEKCSLSFRRKFLGKRLQVLIEGRSPEKSGFWQGYTDTYIKILLKSRKNLKNQQVFVQLKKLSQDGIIAETLPIGRPFLKVDTL